MRLFTDHQLKRFANIFDNAGQVLFGSAVIAPLLDLPSRLKVGPVVFLGMGLTFFLWWVSLRIERISS